MQVASGDDEHAAIKGMYAVGQLVRITPLARDGFLASGGLVRVQKLLQSSRTHARLKRKAISLVTDLIESGGSGEEQKSRQGVLTNVCGSTYPFERMPALRHNEGGRCTGCVPDVDCKTPAPSCDSNCTQNSSIVTPQHPCICNTNALIQ